MKAYEYLVSIRDKATSTLRNVARTAGVADNKLKDVERTTERNTRGFNFMNGALKRVAATLVTAFTITQLAAFTAGIVKTRAEFEKYEAVLTNTFQSQKMGTAAMGMLKDFASSTPYQLNELTGSYVKLVNRGFIPTRDNLVALGDIAASQGKTFDQLTEAILDAETGEFERLKEFGIKASKAGDLVTFAFKGVKKTVKANAKDMRAYLLSLGKVKGVSKSMAVISKTLGGKLSNLRDKIDNLKNSLGKKLAPAFSWIIEKAGNLVDRIEDNIPAFIALAGAVAAVGIPMAAATTYTAGMTLASKFLTAELKKQFAMWLLNPYYWVALAVLAIVGSLIYLYQTNEKVRYGLDYLGGAFKSLYENFNTWFSALKQNTIQIWEGIKQVFNAIFGTMIERLKVVYAKIKESVISAIAILVGTWHRFKNWFLQLWDSIRDKVAAVRDWMVGAFQKLRATFGVFFDPLINSITRAVQFVKDKVVGLLSSLKGKFTDWLGIDVDGMIAGLKKIEKGRAANNKATREYLETANSAGKKAGETGAAKVRDAGGKFNYKDLLPDFVSNALGADENGAGGSGSASGLDGITGGGSKQTTINITLDKLLEQVVVNTGRLEEGIDEIEEKVTEVLLRVLNSANQIQAT